MPPRALHGASLHWLRNFSARRYLPVAPRMPPAAGHPAAIMAYRGRRGDTGTARAARRARNARGSISRVTDDATHDTLVGLGTRHHKCNGREGL